MARPGLYNDNAQRAYPFITPAYLPEGLPADGLDLPNSAIVDFGAVMGPLAAYAPGDMVFLYTITRTGTTFLFEFRTNAAGAGPVALIFTRDLADPEFTTEFASAGADSGSSSSAAGDCDIGPVWEGFLVTGNLAELGELVADGETKTYAHQWQIEPGRIQNLAQSCVTSLNLANYDRTHVTPGGDCGSSAAAEPAIYVQAMCLQDDIKLKPGFNCDIRQDTLGQTITINGSVGAGEGRPCEELPRYPGEEPPAGSTLLTGGPSCTEVIRSINGVGGRLVRLFGGPGITVTPHPELEHTILVTVGLTDFAICS